MRTYIAIVHQEGDVFGASFPDFPGCVTSASSLVELRTLAREALEFHLAGMAEDEEAIPAPSSAELISAAEEYDGAPLLPVAVEVPDSKAVRVNITVPDDALGRIDRFARAHGMSRSAMLVRAAESMMASAK